MSSYLVKTLAVAVALLGAVCVFLWFGYQSYRDKYNASQIALKSLSSEIYQYNDSQARATTAIVQIKEKVQYVEKDCNCYNVRIDDSIIDIVRGNTTNTNKDNK